MADRVIQRNDTAARWQSINPILTTGEIGIEIDGAKGYKIGDGKTRWNDLPYPANPTNVVQDLGNNENAVPSQKLVTEKLSELGSKLDLAKGDKYYGILGIYTDFEVTTASLKQYYNRDRTLLPEQSSQVLRIDFETPLYGVLSFLYTYEGGEQLVGVQDITKSVSEKTITVQVDWQNINEDTDVLIDVRRIINSNIGKDASLKKANDFIFKESNVYVDFGIKSICTDFEFESIRLAQYYNRDRTTLPEQSSQVITFYVSTDGIEERFVFTQEGGSQKDANEDIVISLEDRHIYVNLDWKPINKELNLQLLEGNIKEKYILPNDVLKYKDLKIEKGRNIANPLNLIDKAVIDVNSGVLYVRPNLEGNYVLKINVRPNEVISFGNFTLGRNGAYTLYSGETPTGIFSSYQDPLNGKAATVIIPDGADILYIQVHYNEKPDASFSKIMANYGEVMYVYEPYAEEVSEIKGYKIKGSSSVSSEKQELKELVLDLPVSDGSDIESGYAYIDFSDRCVKVKA